MSRASDEIKDVHKALLLTMRYAVNLTHSAPSQSDNSAHSLSSAFIMDEQHLVDEIGKIADSYLHCCIIRLSKSVSSFVFMEIQLVSVEQNKILNSTKTDKWH